MRSRTIGVIVAAILAVAIAAYAFLGGQKSETKDAYTVAMVTDGGGVDDKSFNQSTWEGVQKYGKENDLKKGADGFDHFDSKSPADVKTNLQQAVTAKYNLVYGVGFAAAPAVEEVAKANPKTSFAIIDSVVSEKNVTSIVFKSEQAAYLAGVAAAHTTKTNKIGFVGGIKGEIITAFEKGFVAGVASVNKDITVDVQYADSFTDTAKAKTIAGALYNGGADVIYQAAGGAGNGVFAEAKALNEGAKEADKVWVVGVDMDQEANGAYKSKDGKESNFTLTSTLKRVDQAVVQTATEGKDGKLAGGKTVSYGLKEKGVGVTRGKMSDKAFAAVEAAQTAILDGKVDVPSK